MVTAEEFKNALAGWASGVSVVAASQGGLHYGLTVSSFTSLSLNPPLILVCLKSTNRLPGMIEESSEFAVSILSTQQHQLSNHFARSGREPSADFGDATIAIDWLSPNLPALGGARATLACRCHERHLGGDHTLIIGEVISAKSSSELSPLLYYDRAYRGLTTLDAS